MATKPPDAFLSYTRFDDQYHHGAISEFREQLSMAVRAVTAQPFEIFQDVEGIGLGQVWRQVLDQKLDQARFFIPVLTPNYFGSEACRDELTKFAELERKSGRNDLILPIYYLTCPVLEDKEHCAADRLAALIESRHRFNWRDLRNHSYRTRKVRLALEALAERVDDARRRAMRDVAERAEPLSSAGRPKQTTKVAPSPPPAGGEEVDVILAAAGDRKSRVIQAVALMAGDLDEARYLVERAPQRISIGISLKHAKSIKKALEGAGATVWVQLGMSTVSRLKPGTVFREVDAEWCPEMVVIPPGEFLMGSTLAERHWAVENHVRLEWVECEKPPHLVRIASPLAVGRYPVTFEEYDYFGTRLWGVPDEGWGRGRRPVINVSWNDAKKYVEWLASKTERPYRLLSEAEWEYTCRAGTTTRYWWGDEFTEESPAHRTPFESGTSEVGKYGANPWGLFDMHGNVMEWVEDCWNDSFDGAPGDGSAWTSGDCARHVLRGGSYDTVFEALLRSAARSAEHAQKPSSSIGFRVARTL